MAYHDAGSHDGLHLPLAMRRRSREIADVAGPRPRPHPRIQRRGLRILAYDRIADLAAFERQIDEVARRHEIVCLHRVIHAFDEGRELDPSAVLIALACGPQEFRSGIRPILRELPSCLLVRPSVDRAEWAEWSLLAAEGETLALDCRGAVADELPRLREEFRAAFVALERIAPRGHRVALMPSGWPADAVEALRAQGLELAFSARGGTNDPRRDDPLRLGCIAVDSSLATGELARRLSTGASPASDASAPPAPEDARASRATVHEIRSARRKRHYLFRSMDAVLTGSMRRREGFRAAWRDLTRRRAPYFDRVHHLTRLAGAASSLVEGWARRALFETARLPWAGPELRYVAYGSAATVYRLELAGEPTRILKVYRWTIGETVASMAQKVRRHRARYEMLCDWFGDIVMPARFAIVHGPLRGMPVVACVQDALDRATDLFGRDDGEIVALLRGEPELRAPFVRFARRVLELAERGLFPDLVVNDNLLLGECGGRRCLRLIDYGLYDRSRAYPPYPEAEIERVASRLRSIVGALD